MDQEKVGINPNSKKKPLKSQPSDGKKQIKPSSEQNNKKTSEKEVKAKSLEKKSPNKVTSKKAVTKKETVDKDVSLKEKIIPAKKEPEISLKKEDKEFEKESLIDKDSFEQEKKTDAKEKEQNLSEDIIKELEEEKTHIEDIVAIHAKDEGKKPLSEQFKGLVTSLKALKIKQKIILGVVATVVLLAIIIAVVALSLSSLNKSFVLNVQSDVGEAIEVEFKRDGSYTLSDNFGLEGYTFQGFFADPYFNEVITSVNKDTKVYAKWVINQYTATFIDSNGNVLGESTVDYLSDAEAPSISDREGYEFLGWDKDFTSMKKDLTVTAQWKANEYKVLLIWGYDDIEGALDVTFGSNYNFVIPDRAGYTFNGWFTQAVGGIEFSSTDQVQIARDHTLYAQWQAITYTIPFDKQNGTGGSDSVDATFRASMPEALAPTRAGYTFEGYFSAEGGKGKQYYSASMQSLREWDVFQVVTLYAKWTNTITFDHCGGTGGSSIAKGTYGQQMPFATAPNRKDFHFKGYFTEPGGQGEQYYASSMISLRNFDLGGTITLYAYWELGVTYTVIFDKQSGTGGSDSIEATTWTIMPGAEAPTRDGYEFSGYFEGIDGTGVQYYDSEMIPLVDWEMLNGGTLYAKWTPIDYLISFNYQGATTGISQEEITVTYDENYGDLPIPEKTGYDFMGWFNASEGGDKITALTQMTTSDNHTLFAQWKEKEFTISFNYQGATSGNEVQDKTVTFNSEYNILPEPTKIGYLFIGWYTSGGKEIKEDDKVEITDSIELIAHWYLTFNIPNTTIAMREMLEASGITNEDYELLSDYNKNAVARYLRNTRPDTGYNDLADVEYLFTTIVAYRLSSQVAVDSALSGDFSRENLIVVQENLQEVVNNIVDNTVRISTQAMLTTVQDITTAVDNLIDEQAMQEFISELQQGTYETFEELITFIAGLFM